MIVLRTPKGWTGPDTIDGKPVEGTFRAHQVPMSDMDKPEHVEFSTRWMRSYQPEELFDATGKLQDPVRGIGPPGRASDAAPIRTPTAVC